MFTFICHSERSNTVDIEISSCYGLRVEEADYKEGKGMLGDQKTAVYLNYGEDYRLWLAKIFNNICQKPKFTVYKLQINKSFVLGVVVHAFNPSTLNVEKQVDM